ncbi:MAG: MauE/DoxX family redox-associated membrane protein [Candidatus Latescibacterota bacterium]|nr:MauE/DoxX family redox-associated membrane protein [Candidatus Latescibacterota bacterium]
MLIKIARISQVIVGIVYLVAGTIKVWHPVLFYWEAVPFTQLLGFDRESFQVVAKGAMLLAPFEVGLGVALIFGWYHRYALPLAILLMAFFTGLLVYAWHIGASVDCGCFGALVERGPGEAAIEDSILLAMLIFSMWVLRSDKQIPWTFRKQKQAQLQFGVLAVAIFICLFRFLPDRERLEIGDLTAGVRLIGLNLVGVDANLQEGQYIIELFSPICGHCIDAVPKLNTLAQDSQVPRVIALTNFKQDSDQLVEFRNRFSPSFEIATISLTDFYRLTYAHGYPRLAYLNEGIVQSVWERDFMPNVSRLREIIQTK